MFDPFFDLITAVLAWFYDLWPSYGMAIVFLTLVVMALTTPLTMKSTRTMMEMQLLAPELKKIQQKHRGNRAELQQAQMEFYREHDLNPMGGCLPIMVQAPVFLVLYRTVMGLTRRSTAIGNQLGFTSSQFAVSGVSEDPLPYQTTPVLERDLRFDPDFLSANTELYKELSTQNEMVSWGFDLSRSASTAMGEGSIESLPYLLMICIVFLTGWCQQRQIQKRQSQSAANPVQQTVMKMMPYFLPVVSYGIPAAVVVYFIISALCRIGQQYYIGVSFYSGEKSLGTRLARQRESSGAQNHTGDSRGGSGIGALLRSGASNKGGGRSLNKHSKSSPHKKSVDANRPKTTAPMRSSRSNITSSRGSGSGRSGKAPSRASRHRNQSGRITPTGRKPKHAASNRSKNKKKRR